MIQMGLGTNKKAAWRVGKPALLFLGFGCAFGRIKKARVRDWMGVLGPMYAGVFGNMEIRLG